MSTPSDKAQRILGEYRDATHVPHGADAGPCNRAWRALWDYVGSLETEGESWRQKALAQRDYSGEVVMLRGIVKQLRAELAAEQERSTVGGVRITGPADAAGFARLAEEIRRRMVVSFQAPGETKAEAVHW